MKKPHCNPAMTRTVTQLQLILGLYLRLPEPVDRDFRKNP